MCFTCSAGEVHVKSSQVIFACFACSKRVQRHRYLFYRAFVLLSSSRVLCYLPPAFRSALAMADAAWPTLGGHARTPLVRSSTHSSQQNMICACSKLALQHI